MITRRHYAWGLRASQASKERTHLMIRNLKFLGMALVAALAMSAVVASLASADEFKSEAENVALTGSQEKHLEGGVEKNDRFTTDGGTVECTTADYTGTQAAKSTSSVTLTPVYSGCTFAGLSADVDMNSCDYRFTIGAATTGEVHLECTTAGDEITVTVGPTATPRCIIHVPPQTIGGITYSNTGTTTTREITASINTATLHYSQTAGTGSGACATADNTTNGSYIGAAKVTGFIGSSHFGLFVQ